MRVEAGADSGAADGEFAEDFDGALDALAGFAGLHRVAGKLLAEREGRRVHEMGAADFNDGGEFGGFLFESGGERGERGRKIVVEGKGYADVERGGDDVVGGLAEIHVVVGVELRAGGAGDLSGALDNDLVGIGVGRCARAGLKNIDGELVRMFAVGDFASGELDEATFIGGEFAEVLVGAGSGDFYEGEAVDKTRGQWVSADGEIEDRALRGSAPEGVVGDLHFAHGICRRAHEVNVNDDGREAMGPEFGHACLR